MVNIQHNLKIFYSFPSVNFQVLHSAEFGTVSKSKIHKMLIKNVFIKFGLTLHVNRDIIFVIKHGGNAMKNVFAIERSKNSCDCRQYDGACFICKHVNGSLKNDIDKIAEEAKGGLKRSGLSLGKLIPQYIPLACGVLIFLTELVEKLKSGTLFSKMIIENSLLNLIACTMILVSAAIFRIQKIRKDRYWESSEYKKRTERSDELSDGTRFELCIPENCESVNVLSFPYKIKKGSAVRANSYDFIPIDLFLFTDDEHFYLADFTAVFRFERANVLRIEKIDKKATMAFWLNDDEIAYTKYKPYKMREKSNHNILIRNYYSLQVSSDGFGVFEILFPPYEIERVAKALDIKITDLPY